MISLERLPITTPIDELVPCFLDIRNFTPDELTSVSFCRDMIFKLGLTNIGYGNSTFIMYHERKSNEFGLRVTMDDLNQGEHVELDSTHYGGTTKTV